MSVSDWLDEVSGRKFIWYVKRLSGNDTLANRSHQAGPYIPRDFVFRIFPSMKGKTEENQKRRISFFADSHDGGCADGCITWYNNKFRGGTRNETRLTNLGGRNSALLDPENTGALTVFAFELDNSCEARECRAWVAHRRSEEDIIEDRIGPVEPGEWKTWSLDSPLSRAHKSERGKPGRFSPDEIPASWINTFPDGTEIIRKAVELTPCTGIDPGRRLIKRRSREFEIFRTIEEAIELPRIREGFSNIEDFLKKAQSILQRRKSRSGRSLELHAMEVFREEGLRDGEDFSYQAKSELGKKPDFLFPSVEYYQDTNFPDHKLRMLAVKTTCRDRWRQILNEADRIDTKHLFTLQEGISVNQFKEMQHENVQLVVPSPLISSYASDIRPHLQTFEGFIEDVRLLKKFAD